MNDRGAVVSSLSGGWELAITTNCQSTQVTYDDVFEDLDRPPLNGVLSNYLTSDGNTRRLENRMVRTVELIPRQSSLNVNDMDLKVKAGAFNFVLSTLFGFGSSLNVQRQREQFSQFVQQELYSAAFGKGSREFGWTFTPMPGTHRLHSGVRTTYAVVVVPENATSLVMESNGCYFPRSFYPPNNFHDTKSPRWNEDDRTSRNCGGSPTNVFVVPIPSAQVDGGNEFWVEEVEFAPVGKGKRVVVAITGKNFSPQTGVLINGVPLVQSIGLAQPLLRDDSETGRRTNDDLKDQEVQGRIERIDSNKVVFSFKIPDFQGTPTITIVSPGRAVDINTLDLKINSKYFGTLTNFKPLMFGNTPDPEPFRIDRVKVFRASPTTLTALVSGAGFGTAAAPPQVFVNGESISPPVLQLPSDELMRFTFDVPDDPTIRVTLVSRPPTPKTIESEPAANPAFLSVSDVDVLVYEAATENEPAIVVVKISGTGFTDDLISSVGEIAVKSATEAILTVPDPKAAAVVTLTDQVTQQNVKIVVTRKTKAAGNP